MKRVPLQQIDDGIFKPCDKLCETAYRNFSRCIGCMAMAMKASLTQAGQPQSSVVLTVSAAPPVLSKERISDEFAKSTEPCWAARLQQEFQNGCGAVAHAWEGCQCQGFAVMFYHRATCSMEDRHGLPYSYGWRTTKVLIEALPGVKL
eukprot:scaffold2754_cov388-Prasinococcus_capsulatus_cf.AAC.5